MFHCRRQSPPASSGFEKPTMHTSEVAQSIFTGIVLVAAFTAMARFRFNQAVVMPLAAAILVASRGAGAPSIIDAVAREIGHVALVLAAVAVPAHQIQGSGLFGVCGARLGATTGRLMLRRPRLCVAAFIFTILVAVAVSAAFLHNITSVLVWTAPTIMICRSFRLPPRFILCGIVVASNLGGFTTRWGDTPNIIEAKAWALTNGAFVSEILPVNALALACLAAGITWLTRRTMRNDGVEDDLQHAVETAAFLQEARETSIDRRRLLTGVLALSGFLLVQLWIPRLEVAAAAGAIFIAVLGERAEFRLPSLYAIGPDVVGTLAAVFAVAACITRSPLGAILSNLIASTGGAVWAVALSSYVGTGLTEAASWAAAAAEVTHNVNAGHAAAWALGAGICAGSSSVLTAASAGIIVAGESSRFPGEELSFRSYLPFGIGASILMLAFYVVVLTILQQAGAF